MINRRKTILINPSLQNRVGLFTGIMAVLSICIGVGSLALFPLLIDAFSQQRTYVPRNILDSLMLSFPWLVLGIGMIFSIAVFLGIFYSHRVAGPIHNIENALRNKLNGEKIVSIHLRSTDHFHGLASLLSQALQRDAKVEEASLKLLAIIEPILERTGGDASSFAIKEEEFQELVDHTRQLNNSMQRQL